jgi:hypothetical protein
MSSGKVKKSKKARSPYYKPIKIMIDFPTTVTIKETVEPMYGFGRVVQTYLQPEPPSSVRIHEDEKFYLPPAISIHKQLQTVDKATFEIPIEDDDRFKNASVYVEKIKEGDNGIGVHGCTVGWYRVNLIVNCK